MVEQDNLGRKVFVILNYFLLILLGLLCIAPIIHVLAISFSSSSAAMSGSVSLWPVEFNLISYQFVLQKPEFIASFQITIQRVLMGVTINMVLITLIAYPLSKEASAFRWRTIYVWFFIITMLFSGGIIPTYIIVKDTGILNTIWALLLPNAVPVFSVVLLLNFFRALPRELEEASFMDGAGHTTILTRIYIPLSMPAIATLTLFSTVGHWNSWFDGIIYMNSPTLYPLQSYLRTVIIEANWEHLSTTDAEILSKVSDRTVKAAQIFLGTLPVLIVYPFLQKYFMKGIVLGSVKE